MNGDEFRPLPEFPGYSVAMDGRVMGVCGFVLAVSRGTVCLKDGKKSRRFRPKELAALVWGLAPEAQKSMGQPAGKGPEIQGGGPGGRPLFRGIAHGRNKGRSAGNSIGTDNHRRSLRPRFPGLARGPEHHREPDKGTRNHQNPAAQGRAPARQPGCRAHSGGGQP